MILLCVLKVTVRHWHSFGSLGDPFETLELEASSGLVGNTPWRLQVSVVSSN